MSKPGLTSQAILQTMMLNHSIHKSRETNQTAHTSFRFRKKKREREWKERRNEREREERECV